MKMAKQNLALAMLTSFLAAVVGAVVWGLLYYQGWFVGYISLLSMLGAGACYLKFYYKIDWKFYVWNILIIVVLNVVASILSDLIMIMLFNNVSFGDAFGLYKTLFTDDAYKTMYILNMVSNLLFCGFGIAFAVFIFYRKNYARIQIEKSTKRQDNSQQFEKKQTQVFPIEQINASAIKTGELILSKYVEILKELNETNNKEDFIKKRQEIENNYVNNLPDEIKKDIINYISTISPTSKEEENAIKLLKIKLS